MTHFGIFLNIHLNIIVLKKFQINFFLKDALNFLKNILRINQWYKGACVAPNSVVGSLTNRSSYMNYTHKQP